MYGLAVSIAEWAKMVLFLFEFRDWSNRLGVIKLILNETVGILPTHYFYQRLHWLTGIPSPKQISKILPLWILSHMKKSWHNFLTLIPLKLKALPNSIFKLKLLKCKLYPSYPSFKKVPNMFVVRQWSEKKRTQIIWKFPFDDDSSL